MNVIFYVPYDFSERKSGSSVRPYFFKKAFENNKKVCVYCISGSADKRKEKIIEVKKAVSEGVKFEFVYFECATFPIFICGGKNKALCMDSRFLLYCHRKGIKQFTYYRDMHWRYSYIGGRTVLPLYLLYYIELFFMKYLSVFFYTPSDLFLRNLPVKFKNAGELCPGTHVVQNNHDNKTASHAKINFVFSGGISSQFTSIVVVLEVVKKIQDVELHICTRQQEWESTTEFHGIVGNNTKIHYLSGDLLSCLLNECDIGIMLMRPCEYLKLAQPIKLYEYVSHGLPIIASEGTLAGDVVRDAKIGWTIPYSEEALSDLIRDLIRNPDIIADARKNVVVFAEKNRWSARVEQVLSDYKRLVVKNQCESMDK